MDNLPLPRAIIAHLKDRKRWVSEKSVVWIGDVVDVNIDLVDPNIVRFRYYKTQRHVSAGYVCMPDAVGKIEKSDVSDLRNLLREFFDTLEPHIYEPVDDCTLYRPRVRIVGGPSSQISLDTLTPIGSERSPFDVAVMNYNHNFRFYGSKEECAFVGKLRQELKDWFVNNGYHKDDIKTWVREQLFCMEYGFSSSASSEDGDDNT